MKKAFQKPLLIVLGLVALVAFTQCSKQRIAQNSFSEPDQFMYDNRPEEQEFVIDGTGQGPITGNQGTRLWLDSSIFMFPNGNDVSYPITIKLIEVYLPKDMELYNLPTVAQGNMLVTDGEVRVRAFKDGEELVLKPNKTYFAQMPSDNPVPEMSLFFGEQVGDILDWHDNSSAVSTNPAPEYIAVDSTGNYYDLAVPVMGWINCDYFYALDPNATTTVSYQSDDDDLTNVVVFLYFTDIHSVMRVYNQESGTVPLGASVKSLCFAMNSAGNLAYHYEEFAISANYTVEVTMTEIAEADLIALMDGL